MSRWLIIALTLGLLVAGVVYDRLDIAPELETAPVEARPVIPAIETTDRLSNVWYCPVGSGATGGYATHQLAITNLGDAPATANIDLVTGDGPGPGLQLLVAPLSTEIVDVAALDPAPNLAATVEIVDGLGVVGHTITSLRGVTQGPCLTKTSDSWLFADGVTTRDSTEFIALLNPFPEDVVFDVTFQTTGRTRKPVDLQSAVVSGRSVRVIRVEEFVTRESHVATTIQTVQGQLAVERLQMFDGSLGPRGSTLQLGVAAPAIQWAIPAGRIHEGGDQRLVVFNPTVDLAEVDVEFELDPDVRTTYGLVPIEVTVQPGRFVVLDLLEAVQGYGVPLPLDLGVRVTSANDVPVVAERWHAAPPIDTELIGAGGAESRIVGVSGRGIFGRAALFPNALFQTDAGETEVPEEELEVEPTALPSQATPSAGIASSRGAEVSSTRWVVPWVELDESESTAIVISGPPGTLVEYQLVLAGELLPPVRSTIPGSGIVTLPVSAAVAAAPILVTGTEPVVVEAQVVVEGLRLNVVPAVPFLEQ